MGQKCAIDKYVNLLGVTYSLCVLLPFINAGLSEYKFKSPQDGKYNLSEHIIKELFFTKLLKTLRLTKNIATVEDVISYLDSHDEVSNRIYTYDWYYIQHLPYLSAYLKLEIHHQILSNRNNRVSLI